MTTLILRISMRLILPIGLVFSLYMAFKGHNEPGGGFIGGLMAAATFAIFRMSSGAAELDKILPCHPRILVSWGLGIALVTAIAPLAAGEPVLRSYLWDIYLPGGEALHIPSAAFFDIGVFLVVIGICVGMIGRFSEELEL
ncbi:MnhB domain-containing protein [Mucisphaera calidilacus]|uniref:Na(+)/H(+) antiporter subunit B n=1 Tax=Mucisphaera calidilacus TaxID=2527982 RepID=A0A518BX68_9BACT|nr:MnhB domain-containing protein [Mucisphaera calidilacus]QDU71569.1 Na(+)/H(+) antiporter subunit B [Mucisphaera calidilacus]